MWRLSLIPLLCLLPTAASADPLTAAIGTAISSATATISGVLAGLTPQILGQAALRLGASFLLSLLAQALTPRPSQKRQLSIPTSRPPKRFVYGRLRTYGTPAPWRVRGNGLYGCIVLNSRPSQGGDIRIFMDKRRARDTRATGGADFTSDIFDFSGPGALLDDIENFRSFGTGNFDGPRVWIGLGDQTSPPQEILDLVGPGGSQLQGNPPLFEPTDGWTGCTVMWVRLFAGSSRRRGDRWKAAPPEFEVEMDWSKVWDPRDPAQDPDDPDTWTFNNNQALVLLDGLRQNPIRRYPMRQIHMPSFIEAANVADEQVPLYHASVAAGVWPANPLTEPRYTANGLLVWSAGELVDQLSPIAQAGAGEIVRIGGQVGYASGEYRAPMLTVSDFVAEGGIDYQVLKPGRDLPRFVKAAYVSPARDWQEAELDRLEVEGASGGVDEDGVLEVPLLFVTSATQAMRAQQIIARQLARQKMLSVTLWPEAVDLVAGATIETALPAPFSRVNGEWYVMSANPGVWLTDAGAPNAEIAVRVPVTLRQNDAQIWEWNPETDEQAVLNEGFDADQAALGAPTNLAVSTGGGISTESVARLRVSFTSVPGADEYEVLLREEGEGYQLATTTESNNVLLDVVNQTTYDVQVRAVAFPVNAERRVSDPAEVLGTTAVVAFFNLPLPTQGQATGGENEIVVSFRAPNTQFHEGIEFWGGDVDDVDEAVLLDTLFGAANDVQTFTETGLGNNVTRFYFARAVGTQERNSNFTASVSATTDA